MAAWEIGVGLTALMLCAVTVRAYTTKRGLYGEEVAIAVAAFGTLGWFAARLWGLQ